MNIEELKKLKRAPQDFFEAFFFVLRTHIEAFAKTNFREMHSFPGN